MKIKTISCFVVLMLAMLLAHPVPRATAAGAPPEPHPEIRIALRALMNAREHLAHGAHDFGGHRVRAIQLTDAAIEQCRIALHYDRH
ncbi:MAG TPA: hypothetical protein VKV79_00735 [Terriglobia bacterium]|nr:hypothetical protein [Terriglobia bacterium]